MPDTTSHLTTARLLANKLQKQIANKLHVKIKIIISQLSDVNEDKLYVFTLKYKELIRIRNNDTEYKQERI